MTEYFILDDIKSTDFGIYIINNSQGLTQSYIPPKRTTTEQINGYDGQRFIDQDYQPKRIPLNLYISDTSQANLNRIAKWLGKKGQFELTLSYEPYKVYTVTIESQSDVVHYMNGGKMNIEFIAHYPLAESKFSTLDIVNNNLIYDDIYYYNSGLVYDLNILTYEFENITTTTNMNIYNGSNIEGARPNIIIDGVADDITITQYEDVNRTVIKDYITYGNFNGTLEINSLLRNSFLNGNVANATMAGRYFKLNADINKYADGLVQSNSGDIIKLDSKSINSDDYYNGLYISIGKGLKKDWYLIQDYNGATNEITISKSLSVDITNSEYGIYDLKDGMNYFTIEGTNMDINNIKFDFKFLYV